MFSSILTADATILKNFLLVSLIGKYTNQSFHACVPYNKYDFTASPGFRDNDNHSDAKLVAIDVKYHWKYRESPIIVDRE